MGTVIAVTSGKGGTGKTSITGGVAASLALMGRRVLCIDMDVGLRNLDISLGLNDRAMMDFADVALGRCPLARAAVEHPDIKGLSLLTAPMTLPASLTPDKVRALLKEARAGYDHILIDSPAGLGAGFRLAVCGADRAIVIATNDASSLRDAQRTVMELSRFPNGHVHLVVNRCRKKLMKSLHLTVDDAIDAAGLPLLGIIPEDETMPLYAGRGIALLLSDNDCAARAYRNIARRLEGRRTPMMKIR